MPGPKEKPSKRPSKHTHVVVITNTTLSQVVCGGFASQAAAEKYANKLNKLDLAFTAVAAPITPIKVVDDFLKGYK